MTWRIKAACRGMDTNLWHPQHGASKFVTQEAKAICAGCQVRNDCLEFALEHEESHGIWGGLGVRERMAILSERRRSQ